MVGFSKRTIDEPDDLTEFPFGEVRVAQLGDGVTRRRIDHFRGGHIADTGDGVLAIFDSPGRAIMCGADVRETVAGRSLRLRIGVHTGEVEWAGGNIRGREVQVAARVMAESDPGELLVTEITSSLAGGWDLRVRGPRPPRTEGCGRDLAAQFSAYPEPSEPSREVGTRFHTGGHLLRVPRPLETGVEGSVEEALLGGPSPTTCERPYPRPSGRDVSWNRSDISAPERSGFSRWR